MAVVLDSSMALAWCIPQQSNSLALGMLKRVQSEGALVPFVWHLEMAKILGLKLRSGNLEAREVDNALSLIGHLRIITDEDSTLTSVPNLLRLMSRVHLTAYDASCVDVAMRSNLSLATFDRAMTTVAIQNGIAVNVLQ